MTTNDGPHAQARPGDLITQSHQLEGNTDRLNDLYDTWATYYDRDVLREGYQGPEVISDIALQAVGWQRGRHGFSSRTEHSAPLRSTIVLDAGCGTGLAGIALARRGFTCIDGFDLSNQMVRQARKSKVYSWLSASLDLNKPLVPTLSEQHYDLVVCLGVFTLGHVPPESLYHLLEVTRPKGTVIVSTRTAYLRRSTFVDQIRSLTQCGRLTILDRQMGAPYIAAEDADYWVMEVH